MNKFTSKLTLIESFVSFYIIESEKSEPISVQISHIGFRLERNTTCSQTWLVGTAYKRWTLHEPNSIDSQVWSFSN